MTLRGRITLLTRRVENNTIMATGRQELQMDRYWCRQTSVLVALLCPQQEPGSSGLPPITQQQS